MPANDSMTGRPADDDYMGQLRVVCEEMAGADRAKVEQVRRRGESLAMLVLENIDDVAFERLLHLMDSCLRLNKMESGLRGDEWEEARSRSRELWLSAWQNLQNRIDAKWDPDDPENSVRPYVPPPGSIFPPSGADPGAVEDPKIRADYEAHLKKMEWIAAKQYQQRKLKKVEKEYSQRMEDYLISIQNDKEHG